MTSRARCFTGHPYLSTSEEEHIHAERRLRLNLWMMYHQKLGEVYDDFIEVFECLTKEDLDHPNFYKAWRRLEAVSVYAKARMQWYEKTNADLSEHDPYCHLATIH